jgi:ankyrin repeat protein
MSIIGALFRDDVVLARRLLAQGADPNEIDSDGCSALMEAALVDKDFLIELIVSGADLNHQNNDGYTALMWTSNDDYVDSLKVLLNAGADPNLKSNTGKTALMLAADGDDLLTVSELLKAGANMYIKDNNGYTVYDYADSEVKKYLDKVLTNIALLTHTYRKSNRTGPKSSRKTKLPVELIRYASEFRFARKSKKKSKKKSKRSNRKSIRRSNRK